jgi:carboxypeptidase C (cathepsin A)
MIAPLLRLSPRFSLLLLAAAPLASPVHADEQAAVEPKSQMTTHSVTIDGAEISYAATAGWLIMKDDDGNSTARFGYTSYVRTGVNMGAEGFANRPIMFAFNGGPGSSSIWLHMGVLGPRRVVVNDGGFAPPPPAVVAENPYSVLDVTDIVMIDPVGTGFSKPLGDATGEDFWGVDQDVRSVAAFIKQYVSQEGRWASPKYILGESYGGVRAAGLVWHLQNRHGMAANGVVLVSPFLNSGSGRDGRGIDKPHVLYLAGLAATAWYHDVIENKPESLEAFVDEVERFAYEEYAPALLAGFTIHPERKAQVAAKLSSYTGVSADYWLKADLRVSHGQFLQELKRDERVIAGRIDSRFSGPSTNPLAERMDYDPFFPSVGPAYTAGFLSYLHGDLKFGQDESYAVSAFGVEWDWKHTFPNGDRANWADLRPDLAAAITQNPGLHVLVQQGYYDLATPITATRHDIAHLDIPEASRDRIEMAYYKAGHMMYLHEPSIAKFRDDLVRFIGKSSRL